MSFVRSIFLTDRTFRIGWGLVILFVASYVWWTLFAFARLALMLFALALIADIFLLYRRRSGIQAARHTAERWSNGDHNAVSLVLKSEYPMDMHLRVLDELPVQFQKRDLAFNGRIQAWGDRTFPYEVRPLQRGVYRYGAIQVFVSSSLGLVERRFSLDQEKEIAVFPSYLQLRKYELLAISDRLTMAGIKRIRRVAQHAEFERIKEYVAGDDRRTVNWKATARRGRLMVNQYQDEKAQQVYSLIDIGRVMKMPFDGLSLLDHSINAALVISSIAMHKEDKAGLMTFSNGVRNVLQASRQRGQMHKVLQTLYAQRTDHEETDMEALYSTVRRQVHQRSLLFVYTNFESVSALHRQLPHLQRLGSQHLVVVIFFLNSELDDDLRRRPMDTQEIYIHTITGKYMHEKHRIVKELERNGLLSVLCRPQDLTVSVINKYLQIKARGML